ncbi:MAG: hypothetical protein ACPLYX_10450 [Rectinema subterraneum]|uniref:hypothetical protein n=1 Tax=Rectinema subterraneum TaxID=2653714 RepID=UPI003C79851D
MKTMNRVLLAAMATISAVFFFSCAIPFDIMTDPITIYIPNTAGIYVEQAIDLPAQALNPKISFSDIIINYKITTNDSLGTSLSVFASNRQSAASPQIGGGNTKEKVLDISIVSPATEKSGSISSPLLASILNEHQPKMVIGIKNLSISTNLQKSITVEISLEIKGEYSLK